MLYDGNPQVLEHVWEDLKSEGKEAAFAKLGSAYLDKMQEKDADGYYAAIKPHMVSGLAEAGLPRALNAVWTALNAGDSAKAKEILKGVGSWFTGLKEEVEQAKAANSEQSKIVSERAKWETEKSLAEGKTLRETTAKEADSDSNKALGKELRSYSRWPFFKGFPPETLVDLGNGIKTRLYNALENDKEYQRAMNALWKQKSPDKAKIVSYHHETLDRIAKDIVDQTIQQRYPGYAKGGSAAGRVAAAAQKKALDSKTAAASVASGKPIYVAMKPKDLVRNPVV